jgi:hypothetical protein
MMAQLGQTATPEVPCSIAGRVSRFFFIVSPFFA